MLLVNVGATVAALLRVRTRQLIPSLFENGTSRVAPFDFIVSQTVSTAYAPDRPEEPVLPDLTP